MRQSNHNYAKKSIRTGGNRGNRGSNSLLTFVTSVSSCSCLESVMPKRLQGVLPIVQTPFLDSDEIDFATLAKEVEWGLAQGIDGLGTGMVSELLKLTAAERQALAENLVKCAAGRAPVFMGVGAESSRQALDYARVAERAGCDAVMATP